MASYMRKFVTEHETYQHDSVVNEKITWYIYVPCFASFHVD